MPEAYAGNACTKCGSRAIIKSLPASDATGLSLSKEPTVSKKRGRKYLALVLASIGAVVLAAGYLLGGLPGLLVSVFVWILASVFLIQASAKTRGKKK